MEKTENYGLNQWGAQDAIKREDFNADNAKTDAALGALAVGMPKLATGSYTGNGNANTGETLRTLDCGFAPKLVVVMRDGGNATYSGLFVRPMSNGLSRFDSNATVRLTWTSTGVSWSTSDGYVDNSLNTSGAKYYWIALG